MCNEYKVVSSDACDNNVTYVNNVNSDVQGERLTVGKDKDNVINVNIAISNIRGLRSKTKSLENIVNKEPFNFIMISETHTPWAEKPKTQGLTHFHRNRNPREGSAKAKGGVSIAAGVEDQDFCTITERGEDGREFIAVKSSRFEPPLTLYSYYGRQENKVSDSETTNTLTEIFSNGRMNADRGEVVVIGGDFNLHVGRKFDLKYNDEKVSKGGADLEIISKEYGFTMMNARACTRDHTTHCDSTTGNKRALDFIFVNDEAIKDVEKVQMDDWEKPEVTPYRLLRKREEVVRLHTDHRTLWMTIKLKKNMKAKKRDEVTRWRISPKGLAEYFSLTGQYAENIVEMAQD